MFLFKKIYNSRILKNIRNYFRTLRLIKKSEGQLNAQTEEGRLLFDFIKNNNFDTVLEIGTWNGLGSTKVIIDALSSNKSSKFYSIETDRIAFKNAKKNLKNEKVNLLYGRILEVNELPDKQEIDFEFFGFDPKNIEWYIQDVRRYKRTKNIYDTLPSKFDFILFDGGEFSTFAEFNKLYFKTKYFALDDINTYKQYEVIKFINMNPGKFSEIIRIENFSIYEYLN